MRLDAIEYRVHETPRTEPFVIASGSSTTTTNVIVRMESGNLVGFGNACPNSVTRETRDTILRSLDALIAGVRGREFETNLEFADAMDVSMAGNPAAKAGLDVAFHDMRAREKKVPLYRFLGGGSRDRMRTDMTIGIMDLEPTVAKARAWVGRGFRALKLKVGFEPAGDVRRVRAVREAVGPEIELRVDGNQGYSIQSAFAVARELAALGVVVFEQPLPAEDLNGMKVLTESSPVSIMADEMVLTPKDAMRVRWGACAKAVNLKLMKHGGLLRAAEVDTVCESAGFPTMIGCMGESVVSVAAALAFALARGNVRWADLDSHMNLVKDVAPPVRFEGGDLVASDAPGLGVRVDPDLFR
ncbi:MAG: dipeptide epimerase [Methanobacteriota archaeon]|nr:MAG: dipeptide epimerase [Euryarchaeota archaeon]